MRTASASRAGEPIDGTWRRVRTASASRAGEPGVVNRGGGGWGGVIDGYNDMTPRENCLSVEGRWARGSESWGRGWGGVIDGHNDMTPRENCLSVEGRWARGSDSRKGSLMAITTWRRVRTASASRAGEPGVVNRGGSWGRGWGGVIDGHNDMTPRENCLSVEGRWARGSESRGRGWRGVIDGYNDMTPRENCLSVEGRWARGSESWGRGWGGVIDGNNDMTPRENCLSVEGRWAWGSKSWGRGWGGVIDGYNDMTPRENCLSVEGRWARGSESWGGGGVFNTDLIREGMNAKIINRTAFISLHFIRLESEIEFMIDRSRSSTQ